MIGPMEMMCFGKFQAAAAAVATFELRARITAQVAPDDDRMHRDAVDGKLSEVIDQIVAHFGATDDETNFLKTATKIRNKLLHLELNQVTKKIEPLTAVLRNVQLRKGQVWSLGLDTGEVRPVSETTVQDDSVYGWMIESTLSGAFEGVVKVMEHAQSILVQLRDKLYKDLPDGT